MKNIVLLLFAFSILTTYGQGITEIPGKPGSITTHGQFLLVGHEVPIEGTPYINEIYKKGETLINGKTKTAALMRYNALNEAVEILDPNQNKPRKLLRRKNIAASFDGKTYVVQDYKDGDRVKSGYFNVLNKGKSALLYRPKKEFVQAENPDNGYDVYEPPHYRDVSEYYIKNGDKPAELVKLRKKTILKAIDVNTSLIKPFIKKHKLDLKKVDDLIQLIDYCNSLNKEPKAQLGGEFGVGS